MCLIHLVEFFYQFVICLEQLLVYLQHRILFRAFGSVFRSFSNLFGALITLFRLWTGVCLSCLWARQGHKTAERLSETVQLDLRGEPCPRGASNILRITSLVFACRGDQRVRLVMHQRCGKPCRMCNRNNVWPCHDVMAAGCDEDEVSLHCPCTDMHASAEFGSCSCDYEC